MAEALALWQCEVVDNVPQLWRQTEEVHGWRDFQCRRDWRRGESVAVRMRLSFQGWRHIARVTSIRA